MHTDAHIHLFDLHEAVSPEPELVPDSLVCASAHSPQEFLWQENFARAMPGRVFLSFGIHPQDPRSDTIDFIESLIAERRIAAIGECGFDLFNEAFRARREEQRTAWDVQLAAAESSGLPLVVHCRKALSLLFADTRRLKRVGAVVFHGWEGSAREAQSFLDRGVNAWFCVGKGILRGDKSLLDTVRRLPVGRLLTETDAPYMAGRGERFTLPSEVIAVAERAAEVSNVPYSEFNATVARSFISVFGSAQATR